MAMKSETKTLIAITAITAVVALVVEFTGRRWLDKAFVDTDDITECLTEATEDELQAALTVQRAAANRGGR